MLGIIIIVWLGAVIKLSHLLILLLFKCVFMERHINIRRFDLLLSCGVNSEFLHIQFFLRRRRLILLNTILNQKNTATKNCYIKYFSY